MSAYADFIASKATMAPAVGRRIEPGDVHPFLHDWQAEIVRWSVERGRAGLWTTTGTGKTVMQLAWSDLSGDTSLIVAPLAVCQQTSREAARKLDMDVRYVRDGGQITGPGVWITNYEMVERFDPRALDAVALDEGCFPAGTLVDTPDGPTPIEHLVAGDEIYSAAGLDVVAATERTEIPYAVRVVVGGVPIICSGTHPLFTQRGWVAAHDIQPGDSVMEATQAVRMVRHGVRPQEQPGGAPAAVLLSILLSELADDTARDQGQGAQRRGGREARSETARASRVRVAVGARRVGANPQPEPDLPPGGAREDLPHFEGGRPRTFRAWGQWSWLDRATAVAAGCTWTELVGGVRCVTGPADSWVSHALQARRGAARAASRYRAGWALAPQPETSRRQEGRAAGFTRVDSLEVLESGDPRLDRVRDADGRLRFYDLQATRHPSYSVAGLLVHNSILRDSTGATRSLLIDLFAGVPRRLSCTATPAPNDAEELTNQSAFLGVMSRVDMLSSYFIHDDAGWRVKGHARRGLYRWMAQWAIALRRPSDIGGSDEGYVLPGLDVVPELVPVHVATPDQLFATDLGGVSGTARVRRETLTARCERAAELVAAEPDEPWLLWAGLNAEAELLARLIPGAVNVHGSMSPEEKAELLLAFADGTVPHLITKPSIAGRGLNFQRSARQAFVGMGYSFEDYFQCIRRSHRYGQTRVVRVHVILSELEQQIAHNVARKEREHDQMMAELVAEMQAARMQEVAA